MDITIQHFFDAAHQLPDSEDLVSKGCANLHGHTYKVIVEAYGQPRPSGMLIDFKAVKQEIDKLDHASLIYKEDRDLISLLQGRNEPVIVFEEPPTAENISKYIHDKLHPLFAARNLFDLSVQVCEGYKGEDRANWVSYKGSSSSGAVTTRSFSIGAGVTPTTTSPAKPF